MKRTLCMILALALCRGVAGAEADTFLAAYRNHRYFRANYLPSLTLSSAPFINKEMNRITQSDGTVKFIRQDHYLYYHKKFPQITPTQQL